MRSWRLDMRAAALWQTTIRVIYPPTCLCCDARVQEDGALCGACWRDTPFISGPVCDGCGAPLMGEVVGGDLCDDCLTLHRPWAQGRAALVYDGNGRRLVLALKHGDQMHLARPAGRWMARAARAMELDNAVVAAVPLHWRRMVKRRYNQSVLLARQVARDAGLELCPDLLIRRIATPSLGGLGSDARYRLMARTLAVRSSRLPLIRDRPILLIDDVMTSGATLSVATEALIAAGSGPVRVLTLARAVKEA
ncbi:double zinc ribbon domain-containing protein [Pseudooceanicola sp. C21-150M6]|uniref:double zinc ribbon domain-containing protein n=1 Tax=Pseudooceanicola sp. C21-150M6 TaxID=3434355 RepID=UPI003D7FDF7E